MENSFCVSTNNDDLRLDNLPDLIHRHLFEYLDLDDLLELKLINKRFHTIINSYSISELFVKNNFSLFNKFNWFSTNKSKLIRRTINSSRSLSLSNPPNNLLNLKYLRIQAMYPPLNKLDDLNKFTQLQILEIKELEIDAQIHLQLNGLKALALDIRVKKSGSLIIDTPNLHSLYLNNYGSGRVEIGDQLELKYPFSIKYAKFTNYDKSMTILSSLECLELFHIIYFEADDLFRFKNLNKLRIRYTNLVSKLKDLFDFKNRHGMNLEIILAGVRIKEIDKLDEFEVFNDDLKFQLDNYGELEDDLHFIRTINYVKLVHLLPNALPVDLFNKFNNILEISIDGKIEDENRLIRFVRECKNLSHLEIKNHSSLSQEFYDQLPAISTISDLKVIENDVQINFKFIMHMAYLQVVNTDQDAFANEDLNISNLKYLSGFRFKIKVHNIRIYRKYQNRYCIADLWKNSGLPDQADFAYDQLIKWFDTLRSADHP